ncbi:hypothetical protein [Arenibaculum pallidiluteum]|uniref:hypothetical protein n=1 Tax=Arenibaculum pallidiluteum TaxID=2812559 RepID=UPI001A969D6A|nr:hypothetical protein [Arenibaculum pallidiluteum]
MAGDVAGDAPPAGYVRAQGSDAPRRAFRITLGLRRGFGEEGRIYDMEEAVRAALAWMRRRSAEGEPFVTGMFTRGEVLYANPRDGAADREPVAVFSGEILWGMPGSDLDDEAVMAVLDDLAGSVGAVLGQEEVHVAFRDRGWTLRRA